jgi:hypothetical protein
MLRSRIQQQTEKTNCRDNRGQQASGTAPLGALQYEVPIPVRILRLRWKGRERERERKRRWSPTEMLHNNFKPVVIVPQ